MDNLVKIGQLSVKKNQLFFFSQINDTADKISVSCLAIFWVSRGVKSQPGVSVASVFLVAHR